MTPPMRFLEFLNIEYYLSPYKRSHLPIIISYRICYYSSQTILLAVPLEKEFVHDLMIVHHSRPNQTVMIKFLIDGIRKRLGF